MIHDAETLRLVQGDGESRLVFARAADGSVVFMPDGQAEQYRARTRSGDLTCIVPDCQNRRLRDFNRDDHRHGFAHYAGAGGHAGMCLHHLQSQLLHRKADRSSVTITECAAHLETLDPDVRLAKDAVASWFHAMVKLGVVECVEATRRDGSRGLRYVTRDVRLSSAERAEAMQAKTKRRQEENRVAEQKVRDKRARDAEVATPPAPLISVADLCGAGYEVPDLPPPLRDQGRCHSCDGTIMPPDVELGYHRGCAALFIGRIKAHMPSR